MRLRSRRNCGVLRVPPIRVAALFRFLLVTLALSAGTPALAGSVAQPGSTLGIAAGAKRDDGIYFENTSSYGQRDAAANGLGVNLTQIVWVTPFKLSGTQLQFFALQPTAYRTNTQSDAFYPNSTYLAARVLRPLGGGWGISYQAGFRAAQASTFAFRQNSLDQRAALTYNADGFNLTANLLNGIFLTDGVALHPNWLNLDLTATKRFGNFEIGPVAFASSDISSPSAAYRREGQIAVGGLIGYDFGTFRFQTFFTRDVAFRGYAGNDTRGWTRLIVPIYNPTRAPDPAGRF